MKYTINENLIRDAEGKLRYQMHHLEDIRSEVNSCLRELQKMAPMEVECRQLSGVTDNIQEEMYREQQLADALSAIADIYGRTEERVIESAWSSTIYRRKVDLTQVTIPHYESGLISI